MFTALRQGLFPKLQQTMLKRAARLHQHIKIPVVTTNHRAKQRAKSSTPQTDHRRTGDTCHFLIFYTSSKLLMYDKWATLRDG
jgi:hypothetical protein